MPTPRARGGPVKPQQPVDQPARPQIGTPPIESTIAGGVSPFMIASLPLMASDADVYARQFYRGSKVPFRRYLPVRSQ
jgi:hypothetical protein